jgi:hypothetical protein
MRDEAGRRDHDHDQKDDACADEVRTSGYALGD